MSDEADALLRRAMALHSAGDIDGALASAREAIAVAGDQGGVHARAHAYLGNTLVARKGRFADGLAELERATTLDPTDAAAWYTLGWCREFVAHALMRPRGKHQPVADDADALYVKAREAMFEALRLHPEAGLRADAEDILDVIAAATGMTWDRAEFAVEGPA